MPFDPRDRAANNIGIKELTPMTIQYFAILSKEPGTKKNIKYKDPKQISKQRTWAAK